MLRKNRLKCGRIPVRLFLACHQKSNTFKYKQFCCAKPMCACLFMGCAPRPRQRRAAVHSSWLSVGSSAHSPANAPELERMRARASCFASRSLAPLSWLIKHCGAAIESLIIKVGRVAHFNFAKGRANQSTICRIINFSLLYFLVVSYNIKSRPIFHRSV